MSTNVIILYCNKSIYIYKSIPFKMFRLHVFDYKKRKHKTLVYTYQMGEVVA